MAPVIASSTGDPVAALRQLLLGSICHDFLCVYEAIRCHRPKCLVSIIIYRDHPESLKWVPPCDGRKLCMQFQCFLDDGLKDRVVSNPEQDSAW